MGLLLILATLLRICGKNEEADFCNNLDQDKTFLSTLEKERIRLEDMNNDIKDRYKRRSEYYNLLYKAYQEKDQNMLNKIEEDADFYYEEFLIQELLKLNSVKTIQQIINDRQRM